MGYGETNSRDGNAQLPRLREGYETSEKVWDESVRISQDGKHFEVYEVRSDGNIARGVDGDRSTSGRFQGNDEQKETNEWEGLARPLYEVAGVRPNGGGDDFSRDNRTVREDRNRGLENYKLENIV